MASFAPIRGTRAQIQATPIVDGQFLVETDQGVDNMIYMDEGSTRTIVGGNTVTGVLPQLYIYSETGSVVTVEDTGGNLIPTSQVGTDHWTCEVPDYGIYTVYSVLSGDTTTQSINVTDCMIYTIDDSHFHCNVIVTYPSGVGASCQISGGGETYSAPALNPPDTSYKFVVHGQNTTYTITTNVDGAIKTQTVTTGTVLDQTYNVTIPYARVNLTVEMPPITGNITCTDGTTTITKTATPNMVFCLPNTGTWTFTGSDGVDTYDTTVEVTDLSLVYNEDLSSAPDGATVLPTDDIQTWLLCAKIKDKTTYSTLDDVLNDNETLQKLISSNNAMNYLVRSTNWIGGVNALVPTLTTKIFADGEISSSTNYVGGGYEEWKAFAPSEAHGWLPYDSSVALPQWLQCEFNTPKIVGSIDLWLASYTGTRTFDFIASNDPTFTTYDTLKSNIVVSSAMYGIDVENNKSYTYYRLVYTATNQSSVTNFNGVKLQLYSANGITDDSIAMRLIGEKNYASNTLLDDTDWRKGICNSDYFESVLNVKVPTLSADNVKASASSVSGSNGAWKAFDGNSSTSWQANTSGGTQTGWIQYNFDTPIKIYKTVTQNYYGTGSLLQTINSIELSGSSDGGSSFTPIQSDTVNYSVSSGFVSIIINNPVAYEIIRNTYSTTQPTSTASNPAITEVQFYGRQDVDETVYNVYSAADDTIIATPQGGGVAIPITTNNDGYGTIAKSSLPNGTYTFVSSKAENPNNLGASDYYTKQITINNNSIIEILVMPDNALYWWGYKSDDSEDCTSANGWTSTYTMSAPTYNINNITCTTTGTNLKGIGTKNAVSNKTFKVIVTSTNTTANLSNYSSKNVTWASGGAGQEKTSVSISSTPTLFSLTQSSFTTGYGAISEYSSNTVNIYAFWYE